MNEDRPSPEVAAGKKARRSFSDLLYQHGAMGIIPRTEAEKADVRRCLRAGLLQFAGYDVTEKGQKLADEILEANRNRTPEKEPR